MFIVQYFLRVIVPAIIVIVGAITIERIFDARISELGRKKELPYNHTHAIKLIVRWTIALAAILLVVSIFGISAGRLWIVISSIAAMIIIGFVAVWSILGNILAGLILMIWRPFEIGDTIEILPENVTGRAKEINLFFTKLKDEEEHIINIPNTQVMQKFIKVISKPSKRKEVEKK
ncbi:hypothetical protein AKJ49_01640 [candidate division MSBL1 archaeon SCGC-AAA382A03]|uniref:Mechanosensitive ion channel MscS domain-containing protein n=1 Tax=candidate division MSBL1 archaeon SCGC-AAA382A03 TaxID=1698278 RepID=A0A133VEF8_9EURY|nr:hypothetical protein AKJ49_01640 [candidate division MSBL1 archaeon SCGC-AAA382A03]